MAIKTRKIRFNRLVPVRISNATHLKEFMLKQLAKEGWSIATIDFIFCDDEYLLKINQDFLGHDTYTDIITFDLSSSKKLITAEIYISVDRVKENAANLNLHWQTELVRVMFHGLLHLCGYSDKSSISIKEMRSREDKWLNQYGFT